MGLVERMNKDECRLCLDVIYAESSINLFYPDTFYLYPESVREIDYIGVLELSHYQKTDYILCILEKVSGNHEESKIFADRILGIGNIVWGMQRHKFGTPLLLRSDVICNIIKSEAENIRDKLIDTLWVDAELYNMIYYSILFLSKDSAKRILRDITGGYEGSKKQHDECYLKYFTSLAKMFYKVMKNERICEIPHPCGYEAEDIIGKIRDDLRLDSNTEFIILFMVQSVGVHGKASEKRIEKQAECIANILSDDNNPLSRYSHAYILTNKDIKDQVKILIDKLRGKGIENIYELWENEKTSKNIQSKNRINEVLKEAKKVILVILSDYRKRSIERVVKDLPDNSCIIVIPESRIEPKRGGDRILGVTGGYLKGKNLNDARVLYIPPNKIKVLKKVFSNQY